MPEGGRHAHHPVPRPDRDHRRDPAVRPRAALPAAAAAVRALRDEYYRHASRDDLVARAVPDLFGAAIAHLRLARYRAPGESPVTVFSPTFDEHGFASPHTVVQVVTDDMPFLPDSLDNGGPATGSACTSRSTRCSSSGATPDGSLAVLDDDTPAGGDHGRVVPPHRDRPAGRPRRVRATPPRPGPGARRRPRRGSGRDARAGERHRRHPRGRRLDPRAGRPGRGGSPLRWLADGHFTFLGYREYEVVAGPREQMLQP